VCYNAHLIHLTSSHHVGIISLSQEGWVEYNEIFWDRNHIHITFIAVHCYNSIVTVIYLLLCLMYKDRVSPSWPQIHDPPASASQMLELQVCNSMPGSFQFSTNKVYPISQTWVVHTCNPSYLGGWDREDWGSRPALANISWDPISKIARAK
jgi:hypothetical protein